MIGFETAGIIFRRFDASGMENPNSVSSDEVGSYDVDDVLSQLEVLEETVNRPEERLEVQRTKRIVERIPGSGRIRKYTTRDIAEGFVGGIVFSLPLLVEDGVFEIAEWFAGFSVGPLPLFLTANTVFIVCLTAGLLYATDIRDVRVTNPLFGFIPRRLVGVLVISLIVAAGMMFMWGRLHEEDPTVLEQFGRITVIWAAAALGATLGDILPGESQGEDISDLLGDLGENNDTES